MNVHMNACMNVYTLNICLCVYTGPHTGTFCFFYHLESMSRTSYPNRESGTRIKYQYQITVSVCQYQYQVSNHEKFSKDEVSLQ